MAALHGQGLGWRWGFKKLPCPLWGHHPPSTPRAHQPRSSPNPVHWGLYGDVLQKHANIGRW